MENYIRKIKCDVCNKYYTFKYMQFHQTSFKHIENEMNIMLKKILKNNMKIILHKLDFKLDYININIIIYFELFIII